MPLAAMSAGEAAFRSRYRGSGCERHPAAVNRGFRHARSEGGKGGAGGAFPVEPYSHRIRCFERRRRGAAEAPTLFRSRD
jgi:hypothetical protein